MKLSAKAFRHGLVASMLLPAALSLSGKPAAAVPISPIATLHNFAGGTGGAVPVGGLVQGSDGSLYGTTKLGATSNGGVIYKISPTGVFSVLHSDTTGDGWNPTDTLCLGADGNLYGTAGTNGANGHGTVFKITPAGAYMTLYSFTDLNNDGAFPVGGLVQGADGAFYGATGAGGTLDWGMTYKITSAGVLTQGDIFALNSTDGWHPQDSLILASDGNFYGTARDEGANGFGTVFKETSAGVLTTLHQFAGGTDGQAPYASLVQGPDGNFYGTTFGNSSTSINGTVFKMTPAGTLTTVHSFAGGSDGANPLGGLVLGSDGNLWGDTERGGINDSGTIFKVSPTGVFTSVYAFGATDGWNPADSMMLGRDGGLYGTASGNGNGTTSGTVFRFETGGVHNVVALQSATTGQVLVWGVSKKIQFASTTITPTPAAGLTFVGTADFNGDLIPDILFQDQSTGILTVWYLNKLGAMTTSAGTSISPAAAWKVVGVADINGDGKADILFQNSTTNQLAVWYMNGVTRAGGSSISVVPPSGWKAAGIGDYNWDGKPDIVLQNQTTGQVVVWYMNGATRTGGAAFSNSPGSTWKLSAVVNISGGGFPNLIFQKGSIVDEWTLNGTHFVSGGGLSSTLPTGFNVVGPR